MNIQEKIIEIIAPIIGTKKEQLSLDSLIENFDNDSLTMVEIAVGIEDAFLIEINDDQLFKAKTINDILQLVELQVTAV